MSKMSLLLSAVCALAPAPDASGAAIVREVAGDILGLAADTGPVLRKYQRVVERFEACCAMNNGAEPAPEK
ncbi:hypothetical protein GCM10007386_47420 [Pseudoduganella dura]|nr:hypothetical protein GCM10007386_47420 [Pseudoduganella dura]